MIPYKHPTLVDSGVQGSSTKCDSFNDTIVKFYGFIFLKINRHGIMNVASEMISPHFGKATMGF